MAEWMQGLEPGQIIALCFGGLLALAGLVNTVIPACEKIVKVFRAAKAPNEAQDARLDGLEAWRKEKERQDADTHRHIKELEDRAQELEDRVKELEDGQAMHKRLLAKDKEALDALHNDLRLSHMAQLALLDHALNGNNIDQMQDAKDALVQHLANK